MAVRNILLLRNPLLNQPSEPVKQDVLSGPRAVGRDLHDTLMDFRARHRWDRASAAPQIGVFKRIIYLALIQNFEEPLSPCAPGFGSVPLAPQRYEIMMNKRRPSVRAHKPWTVLVLLAIALAIPSRRQHHANRE